ncbi:MAG: hypothetical protein LBH67_02690, partial [Rickettsia sp.]|nr:hypothetical protein [Rickettsia sp.]
SIKSIISDICIFLSHYLYELNLYTIFSYILTPFLTFNSCDSSTGSTHKLPAEVEFCKRSINFH